MHILLYIYIYIYFNLLSFFWEKKNLNLSKKKIPSLYELSECWLTFQINIHIYMYKYNSIC